MGNSAAHGFYKNIDVLIKIFEMLEFQDQLNLKKIDQNLHDVIVRDIQHRKIMIKTYLAKYDDETLLDYWKEYGDNVRQLTIMGYGEFLTWKPMRTLLHLTDISIKNVKMYKHDIYWMVEKLQNLQSLRLYNVNGISLYEDITNCEFISESMRELQLPFADALLQLIENCTHLKELQIDAAPKYVYEESINHPLISMEDIKSQIKELENSFSLESSIYPRYSILAKANAQVQVHLISLELYQQEPIENSLRKKVSHLRSVKHFSLDTVSLKCANISVNNSPQLHHLHICNMPMGLKFNANKTLRYLHFENSILTSHGLFSIVNNLNLRKLRLSSRAFKQSNKKDSYQFAENFNSSIRHLRIDYQNNIFEQFFAQYSEVFKNLKQLKFHRKQISARVIEFLVKQNSWKLKHLIFDDCDLNADDENLLANLKQSQLISENVTMFECYDVNSNFLLQHLTLYKVHNLNIYAMKDGNIAMANKMDYKLDKNTADHWPKSIRSIAIDNFSFCLNRYFWFDYLEQCHTGMQFTIYNACDTYLYKLFYNSQIRSKIRDIKFGNKDGKVHVDEKVLCQLPISISTLDCIEYCTLECFENAELLTILIVTF